MKMMEFVEIEHKSVRKMMRFDETEHESVVILVENEHKSVKCSYVHACYACVMCVMHACCGPV